MLDQTFFTPTTYQWNLTLQRTLPDHFVLDVSVMGVVGHVVSVVVAPVAVVAVVHVRVRHFVVFTVSITGRGRLGRCQARERY